MSRPVITISPASTVRDAAETMCKHNIGLVVVTDEIGRVQGILSERDIVVLVAKGIPLDTPVKDVMKREVVTTHPDTSVWHAARIMAEHRIRHLVVVENGKVVGVISTRDVFSVLKGLLRFLADFV